MSNIENGWQTPEETEARIEQAQRLKPQAAKKGMRFEAYFVPRVATNKTFTRRNITMLIGMISAYAGLLFNPYVEGEYGDVQDTISRDEFDKGEKSIHQIAEQGWIKCDGGKLDLTNSHVSDYYMMADFAWGGDVGEKYCRAPDLRGVFARGVDGLQGLGFPRDPDSGRRDALWSGGNTGRRVGSAQSDLVGTHHHGIRTTYQNGNLGNGWGLSHANPTNLAGRDKFPDLEGLGEESRPRNVYVNWIVKISNSKLTPVILSEIYLDNQDPVDGDNFDFNNT